MRIPIVNLKPSLAETRGTWEANFAALLERGFFVLGPELQRFEEAFASAMGAAFAVGVSSGSSAIELCLRDSGVSANGQEVLTSALTAPFTAVSIAAAGATPRFADIDPETLQMDAGDAAGRMGKSTAALLPVHLYGQPCRIDRFAKLAKEAKVKLVQDACQAHGAKFEGRALSEFGDYVTYSFYPTKNLGCLGDGGAIVTNKAAVAKRLLRMRDGGRGSGGLPRNQIAYTKGINARLDELQAGFLNAFLPKLEEWNASRQRLAALYDQMLADVKGVRLVKRHACSVCHLYVIRAGKREKLREYLAGLGIGSGIHYPVPLHLHPAFATPKLKRGGLPHAEQAAKEILSLPLWPQLTEDNVGEVAEALRRFYNS